MTLDKRADPTYLRESAYAEPSGFMARVALYDHQQPKIDLVTEAVGLLGPVVGLVAADIGCGNGRYVTALGDAGANVIGVDLSPGMLKEVPGRPTGLVAADGQRLPLIDGSVDIAVLMHMLYHVPDPGVAVREAARVVRSGGRLLLATNADTHLAEMDAVWLPLLEDAGVGGRLADLRLVNWRFDAADARALLRERFETVDERVFRSAVVLTEPAPALAHAASTTGSRSVGTRRDELLNRFRDAIGERIAADGQFQITTEVVFFLCEVN